MATLFDPPAPIIAPTTQGPGFPVRRLFCIGQNYAAHAREMGATPDGSAPFFFTKWTDTVALSGTTIAYPPETSDYHFEAELVVAIGKGGRSIAPADAADHIYGYAAGLDMTRRDLQAQAKGKGRPWDVAKNVEQAAPLGLIHPANETGAMDAGHIGLTCNGDVRQDGDLSDMITSIPDIIAYISRFYRLEPGDLIYTGTPSGVGPVAVGDHLIVTIDGLTPCEVRIGAPEAA